MKLDTIPFGKEGVGGLPSSSAKVDGAPSSSACSEKLLHDLQKKIEAVIERDRCDDL